MFRSDLHRGYEQIMFCMLVNLKCIFHLHFKAYDIVVITQRPWSTLPVKQLLVCVPIVSLLTALFVNANSHQISYLCEIINRCCHCPCHWLFDLLPCSDLVPNWCVALCQAPWRGYTWELYHSSAFGLPVLNTAPELCETSLLTQTGANTAWKALESLMAGLHPHTLILALGSQSLHF